MIAELREYKDEKESLLDSVSGSAESLTGWRAASGNMKGPDDVILRTGSPACRETAVGSARNTSGALCGIFGPRRGRFTDDNDARFARGGALTATESENAGDGDGLLVATGEEDGELVQIGEFWREVGDLSIIYLQ
jgi:hypothetical protein